MKHIHHYYLKDDSGIPIVSIAAMHLEDATYYGASIVSFTDLPSKSVGRDLAEQRLLKALKGMDKNEESLWNPYKGDRQKKHVVVDVLETMGLNKFGTLTTEAIKEKLGSLVDNINSTLKERFNEADAFIIMGSESGRIKPEESVN